MMPEVDTGSAVPVIDKQLMPQKRISVRIGTNLGKKIQLLSILRVDMPGSRLSLAGGSYSSVGLVYI
jgi:hypothetical protein